MQGFVYSALLTKQFRHAAQVSKPDGFSGQHLWATGAAHALNPTPPAARRPPLPLPLSLQVEREGVAPLPRYWLIASY